MGIEATQQNVQETFDYLFGEASKVLELGGSFAPFGAAIRESGERTHVNVDLPIDRSTPNDHISGLILGFRQEAQAGRIFLAGLAFDGRMTSDGSAVQALVIHIESAQGEGMQVFVPYTRGLDAKPVFERPVVQPITPEIFTLGA
ncbi:MAG: hypothetical protein NW200_12670 [Hyphomonadaceae bacterium]|nr:hypothetical protein [Hyphomonadaceae bacterium]